MEILALPPKRARRRDSGGHSLQHTADCGVPGQNWPSPSAARTVRGTPYRSVVPMASPGKISNSVPGLPGCRVGTHATSDGNAATVSVRPPPAAQMAGGSPDTGEAITVRAQARSLAWLAGAGLRGTGARQPHADCPRYAPVQTPPDR